MISSAFKGAVQSEVQSQGQAVGTAFQPAKEFAGTALGMLGLKGIGAAAMSSMGEAATQAITQEKMLSAVQSQEALDNAFMRSIEGESQESVAALTTVYEKLAGAKKEQDAKRKLMEELKNGDQVEEGYTRLYRGLEKEYDPNYKGRRDNPEGYESWTNSKALAKQYGKNVYYIDVKNEDISESYLDENPKSETYGDRNYIYKAGKPAGLNGISGEEYLLYTEHDKHEKTKYNKLGE